MQIIKLLHVELEKTSHAIISCILCKLIWMKNNFSLSIFFLLLFRFVDNSNFIIKPLLLQNMRKFITTHKQYTKKNSIICCEFIELNLHTHTHTHIPSRSTPMLNKKNLWHKKLKGIYYEYCIQGILCVLLFDYKYSKDCGKF